MHKIPLSFYQQEDVVQLSRSLLGKYLLTCFEGQLTGGVITETEAYMGLKIRRATLTTTGVQNVLKQCFSRVVWLMFIYAMGCIIFL